MMIKFNIMQQKHFSWARHRQDNRWLLFLNLFGFGILITNYEEV